MAMNTAANDIDIEAVVDYCLYRVGNGLYAGYSYDDIRVEKEYLREGISAEQTGRFKTLVEELYEYHQRLSETRVASQKSTLHLHDGYCVVQLVFNKDEGLVLFFDEELASNHTDFVDSCFSEAYE